MYRSLVFVCLCVVFLCSSCGQRAPVHDSRFQTEDYLIDYDVSPEYVNAEGTFCRYESTYYDIIGQWILYYDAAGETTEKCMWNLYAYDISEHQIEQIWSTEESWSPNNVQIRDHEIYFLDLRLDFLSTEGGIVRYSQFDPAARTMRNGEEIALEPGALGAYMVDGYLITSCYTADPEERYDRYWVYAEDHALVGTGSITHYAMPIGKDEMDILMSAGELAEKSGVNLRTLQEYDNRAMDINRAVGGTLTALSKVLGCQMEDLLEYDYAAVTEK